MQLITASVDTRIRVWDLVRTKSGVKEGAGGSVKPVAVLEDHASVPRGLDVTRDGKWLVSGGRDSLIFLYDISSKSPHGSTKASKKGKEKEKASAPVLVKTITAHERVEAVGFLGDDVGVIGSSSKAGNLQIYAGGGKGTVKVWDARSGSVLFSLGQEQEVSGEDQEEQRQIVDVM